MSEATISDIYVCQVNSQQATYVLDKIINSVNLGKRKIFIKPNVRSCHSPESAKTTNPKTLSIVLEYLKSHFDNEIIVADGSIIGVDTKKAATAAGILRVCEEYEVPFIDLRECGYRRIEIPIEPYFIEISNLVFDGMYLINMPKLKSTYGFPLSLSAKNLKGVISDRSKLDFHTYGIQERVKLLTSLVQADVSIIDGLYSLSLDTALDTDILIASNNSLALDSFVAKKMGYTVSDMHYLLSDIDNCNIHYYNEKAKNDIESIELHSINKEEVLEKFGVSIIGNPCSACTGCIYKAVAKKNGNTHRNIVAGVYNESLNGDYYVVGNCAIKQLSKEKCMGKFKTIRGCPPPISEIIRVLNED